MEIDDIFLQQDNAMPHISDTTTVAIARLRYTVLPHPAYSLDLAPSNFHLFPKLKEDPRDQNISSDVEVKAALCRWIWYKQKKTILRTKFKNLLNAVKSGGSYVEK